MGFAKWLRKENGGKLNCWFVDERLLLLATSESDNRLCLVDLTRSIMRGEVMDVHAVKCCRTTPLRNFDFQVRALPFAARAEQNELATIGGEILEIHPEITTHLSSGWVAARENGGNAPFLWIPLARCQLDVTRQYI